MNNTQLSKNLHKIPTKSNRKNDAQTMSIKKKIALRRAEEASYSNLKGNSWLMILPRQPSKKDGKCRVYVELRIAKQTPNGTSYSPKRLPTEIRVFPENWSQKKEEVKTRDPDHKVFNEKLKKNLRAVEDFTKANIDGASYLKTIPSELETYEKHFDNKQRKTLLDYLEEYIGYRQSNSVRGTWKEFKTLKGRLERFQSYENKNLYFEDMTFEFAESLKAWAKTVPLDPNTVKEKVFGSLTTFLNHYFRHQHKLNFFLPTDYKDKEFSKVSGTHSSDPVPLYIDEIEKLLKFHPKEVLTYTTSKGKTERLTINAQYRIKNLFLLSCFTGLRYGDVVNLSKGNFNGDTVVVKASKTDRNKGARDLYIPVLPPTREIAESINYDFSRIKLSNQKANMYLNEYFGYV